MRADKGKTPELSEPRSLLQGGVVESLRRYLSPLRSQVLWWYVSRRGRCDGVVITRSRDIRRVRAVEGDFESATSQRCFARMLRGYNDESRRYFM